MRRVAIKSGYPGLSAWVIVYGWLVFADPAISMAQSMPSVLPVVAHQITIQSRQFTPPVIRLRAGQPVRLEFHNHDSELHAVVPQQWLDGVNVAISGNGAPEFGDTGLHRVIIPAGGHAELQFTLRRAGTYAYICDMPGHEMRGVVEVQE